MKRSEMVKLMWDFIQSVETNYDIYMTLESTAELLQKMEAAGMLPPRRSVDTTVVVNGVYIPEAFRPSATVSNEWEPEGSK